MSAQNDSDVRWNHGKGKGWETGRSSWGEEERRWEAGRD